MISLSRVSCDTADATFLVVSTGSMNVRGSSNFPPYSSNPGMSMCSPTFQP